MEVQQPIGTFYIGKVKASDIVNSLEVHRRDNNSGIQRKIVEKRVKQIEEFAESSEATFPTPIIISVKNEFNDNIKAIDNNISIFTYEKGKIFGEIIDGQHRIEGIKTSEKFREFEIVIILMFNMTEEEKAYVFTTINSNQRSVPKSLIYDLFDLSEKRSPYKTCHEIARLLNSDKESPFYKRLKMLGIKKGKNESLSQGAFVNGLVPLISKNPERDMRVLEKNGVLDEDQLLPFRNYFINNEDHIIYKIILNMFNAIAIVFPEEWNDTEKYILMRAVGYAAVMKAFPIIYSRCKSLRSFKEEKFIEIFAEVKSILMRKKIDLSFDSFEASGKGTNQFRDIIEEAVENLKN